MGEEFKLVYIFEVTVLPSGFDDSTNIMKNCEWLLSIGKKVEIVEESLGKNREDVHMVSLLCYELFV